MYLQKCEEYSGVKMIGSNENKKLYKRLFSSMMVELKQYVPYIMKSVPTQNIDGKWIKEHILHSLKTWKNCGVRVRAMVSDNHSANVLLAYKLLLKNLFILMMFYLSRLILFIYLSITKTSICFMMLYTWLEMQEIIYWTTNASYFQLLNVMVLTLFRISLQFFHVTSTNLGIGPQIFLTFSSNPFATLL